MIFPDIAISTAPIGVFDSGVGGLTVLNRLLELLPEQNYIYLGDTARVPYGNKSAETVKHYALQCSQFLVEQGAKFIVVACNTASAVALDYIRSIISVPIIGVIEGAASVAVAKTLNKSIGVIGTKATIRSEAYTKEIVKNSSKTIAITSVACPLLVPIVEENWQFHPATKLIIQEYAKELHANAIDTLVLGCTHYPMLKDQFLEEFPNVTLIDCGQSTAELTRVMLPQFQQTYTSGTNKSQNVSFYITDNDSNFPRIAQAFLGFIPKNIQTVDIESVSNFLMK